jgi:decaprenylphospho-beta-D-ribofuranose 2-oxidase
MGFTGIILTATLRLKKLAGNQLQINTINAKNIEEAVAVMQQHSGNFDYVYSWNNFNRRGDAFGKGIVYLEKITEQMVPLKKPKPFVSRLPSNKWPALWNGLTIPLMCHFYYTMNQVKPVAGPVSLYEASFPIYGKEIYYHLFGRKGFREYQVIFPYDTWPAACAEIKKLVAEEGVSIALGSLKLFRGATHNISFSGEGICVAIDVPNTKKSIVFLKS